MLRRLSPSLAPYGHGWGSWNVSRSKGPLGDICEKDRFIFFLNLLELPVQSCKSESFILLLWHRDNWEGTVCYNSCPSCNPSDSCEWTSCYDDVAYTLALLDKVNTIIPLICVTIVIMILLIPTTVLSSSPPWTWPSSQITSEYCVEQNSIHQSGMSNGAMFSYIIATKTDR